MGRQKPDHQFWTNKRVLITGHTGFKGAWLSIWLNRLGAHIAGLSLAPHTVPNLFDASNIQTQIVHQQGDICDPEKTANVIADFKPQIIFHLAAQALVRPSYEDPLGTFSTNVMGTAHVLDAVRCTKSVVACIVATTDKVYKNLETGRAYTEEDPLGGHDPYSASKAAAEMVVDSYRKSYFGRADIGIAVARAGNVIGGGDWSDERLIPDAVKAWHAGHTLTIRRPDAVRPWQHVLDALMGYIVLAETISSAPKSATDYNFGPDANDKMCVKDLIGQAQNVFGKGETEFATCLTGPHEAGLLSLDTSKAKTGLGISPRWPTSEAIERTMEWYKAFYAGADARQLCYADIDAFEAQK